MFKDMAKSRSPSKSETSRQPGDIKLFQTIKKFKEFYVYYERDDEYKSFTRKDHFKTCNLCSETCGVKTITWERFLNHIGNLEKALNKKLLFLNLETVNLLKLDHLNYKSIDNSNDHQDKVKESLDTNLKKNPLEETKVTKSIKNIKELNDLKNTILFDGFGNLVKNSFLNQEYQVDQIVDQNIPPFTNPQSFVDTYQSPLNQHHTLIHSQQQSSPAQQFSEHNQIQSFKNYQSPDQGQSFSPSLQQSQLDQHRTLIHDQQKSSPDQQSFDQHQPNTFQNYQQSPDQGQPFNLNSQQIPSNHVQQSSAFNQQESSEQQKAVFSTNDLYFPNLPDFDLDEFLYELSPTKNNQSLKRSLPDQYDSVSTSKNRKTIKLEINLNLSRLDGDKIEMFDILKSSPNINSFLANKPILVEQADDIKKLEVKVPIGFSMDYLKEKMGDNYLIKIVCKGEHLKNLELKDAVQSFKLNEIDEWACLNLDLSKTILDDEFKPPNVVYKLLKLKNEQSYKISKNCLISMKNYFMDFRLSCGIEFYYLITGYLIFYFIEPTVKNKKVYSEWLAKDKNETSLVDLVETKPYQYVVHPESLLFLPQDWIYAFYTLQNSLAFIGDLYSINSKLNCVPNDSAIDLDFLNYKSRFPFFRIEDYLKKSKQDC